MSALPSIPLKVKTFPRLVTEAAQFYTTHEGGVTEIRDDDASTQDLMNIVEASGTLDFWNHPDEDIYSLEDGDPV